MNSIDIFLKNLASNDKTEIKNNTYQTDWIEIMWEAIPNPHPKLQTDNFRSFLKIMFPVFNNKYLNSNLMDDLRKIDDYFDSDQTKIKLLGKTTTAYEYRPL